LTERRQQFARVLAVFVGLTTLSVARTAAAQGALRDTSGTVTVTAPQDQTKTTLLQRFAGSTAEITTYIGSGSFYTSGYRDPYVANAFYVRPQYDLGTRYKLSLAGRVYVEEEYTTPDTPNGRRFNPLDSFIYLNAKNIYTMPRAKVRFFGGVRASIPLSYESRYAHLITSLGISGGASRAWELGRPNAQGKRWNLSLTWGEGFSKAIRTSDIRGSGPGDTANCRTSGPFGFVGGPGAAEDDRCGGPLSTSFAITSSLAAALARGRYSLSISLIVLNEFKYTIDQGTFNMLPLPTQYEVATGRVDNTWGVISFGYDINDHFALSVGLASLQPALDSTYQHLRFPFFDFYGANANNYTQVLVGVSGTL
jgi:hypothetical protein